MIRDPKVNETALKTLMFPSNSQWLMAQASETPAVAHQLVILPEIILTSIDICKISHNFVQFFYKTVRRLSLSTNRRPTVGGLPVRASRESFYFICLVQSVHATAQLCATKSCRAIVDHLY
jgi:hypothetical protein